MLNEERVKMMIKLASYEEGQGKEDFKVNSYYRKDYVSFHTIVTLIWTTIGYGLAVGLFFLVNLEKIFEGLTLAKFFLLGVYTCGKKRCRNYMRGMQSISTRYFS